MRFLNKFYSFMKSIYLNNSKYSNNLRHSLRIFFEREVKTKHTPTLFGTTFKGSKWVDYSTFNINKLFIKSGLNYFYYIGTLFTVTLIFLGRSKSEQYFGFLPFFSYVNFIMGYIPLVLSDITSQIIVSIYSIYIFFYKALYVFINKITSSNYDYKLYNFTNNLNVSNKFQTNPNLGVNINSISNLSSFENLNLIPTISKNISKINLNLNYINQNPSDIFYNKKRITQNTFLKNPTLLTITLNSNTYENKLSNLNITGHEASYLPNLDVSKLKTRNVTLSLNDLYIFYKQQLHKSPFNFNLESNLNLANQQRWLAKNSLLSESIVHNSFRITQAKKLLGTGSLNPNYTSKSLWLPSQTSKLSTLESSMYLNNLSSNFNKSYTNIDFLQTNQTTQSNLNNLNFFENSRFFLLKKYFFTNSQNQNIVINSFQNLNQIKNPLHVNVKTHLNTTLNTLTQSYNNLINPSLNNLDVYNENISIVKYESTNLVDVNTPNLNVFNNLNLQFFFIVTSNFNQFNKTNYFNYLGYTNNEYEGIKNITVSFNI